MRIGIMIIGRIMVEQGAEETNEGALDLLRCRPSSSSHARSQCEDSGGRADNKCLLKKELAARRACHDLSPIRAAAVIDSQPVADQGVSMTRTRREVTS